MEILNVAKHADWDLLRNSKLMTIVDPMVFRTADLFLSGRPHFDADDSYADQVWETISLNIGGLATFFDGIIMRRRLPIFSYWDTFQEGRLLALNEKGEFLAPVVVTGEVYKKSKESAIESLKACKPIPDKLGDQILAELEAFGYTWQPYFEGQEQLSPRDRRLQTFLLGGLIFGGYAQQLSIKHETADFQAEHVLQPKRSQLFLASVLGDVGRTTTKEPLLIQRLKRISKDLPEEVLHTIELPAAPTFLPLLLRYKPKTPRELLELALKWRDKHSVNTFREWYRNMEIEVHRHYVPRKIQRELDQLRKELSRELGPVEATSTTVSAKFGASAKLAPKPEIGAEAAISAEQQVDTGRLKWFFQSLLPGYSYRKLFVRMAIANKGYAGLTRHLAEIWHHKEK